MLKVTSRALTILLLALAVGASAPAAAQSRSTAYEISFPTPGTHEAHVVATFTGVPAGPLEVRMSRSSPGRYAVHEFAKNVYSVTATDGAGRPLSVDKPDPYGWTVTGHDGTVRFSYVVYGDRTDGTFLGVDVTHAHMNMPATFAWARGLEDAPIRLTIRTQPGWHVATQLAPTSEPNVFTAPNLQYYLDSPTEASAFTLLEWTQPEGDQASRYRIALHHTGTEAKADSFAMLVRRVVAEQHGIWGGPPAHDYGTYTFIVDYLPWANGDGMEHRNSTIVTSTGSLADSAARVARLGTMSHELFHQWNVERLRPVGLEPFDFERANMTDALWFAEGFTQYYGPLAIRRAGIYTDADYARQLGGPIIATIRSQARAYGSAADMSERAPFVDAATSIDPTHHYNIFLSYYTWGAAIGAGLDLTLRTRFDRTLDEWLRVLWRDFGSRQTAALAPARPYTLDDLRESLGRFTGDATWANEFFRRYVEGNEVLDYERLLASAGFLLATSAPEPWLGASLADDSLGVRVNASMANGALFPAGINNGDVIVSIDGSAVHTVDALNEQVALRNVGQTVRLEVIQRDGRHTIPVRLAGRSDMRLTTYEDAGRPVTADQMTFRAAWLGTRTGQ